MPNLFQRLSDSHAKAAFAESLADTRPATYQTSCDAYWGNSQKLIGLCDPRHTEKAPPLSRPTLKAWPYMVDLLH